MHPLQNGSQVTERPANKPVSGLPGYFTESGNNNVPSYPGADWFNHVIDEFINLLNSRGIPFDPEKDDHLLKAFESVDLNVFDVQLSLSNGFKQLNYSNGDDPVDSSGVDRVYFNNSSYWYAWEQPSGDVISFSENNDYGTAVLTTDSGTYEFVKSFVFYGRQRFEPFFWGVKANGLDDDILAWERLMDFYKTKVQSHVESGMTPLASMPKMRGIVGNTKLSRPLVLYGFLNADFSFTQFNRHQNWNQPSGTYLLTSTDMYQADFGNLSFFNVDYALNIENQNLDNGLIEVSGIKFSKCNHALRSNCQSSNVRYSDFRFDNCKRMIDIVRGDRVILERGNLYQAPLTGRYDCSIDNRNAHLVVRDVIGVPAAHTGQEVAWINNSDGGRVDVSGFRAGAENGGGCALINNFAKFKRSSDIDPTPVSLRVNKNMLYSVDTQGGAQKSCIIRLFEMPNVLHFKGNEGMVTTQEVITFGLSVNAPASLVDEVISKLSNFSFRYDHNSHDREVSKYSEELLDLFMPSDSFPLAPVATATPGLVNCETRIRPLPSAIYDVFITGAVLPSSSPYYQATVHGVIDISTLLEGGKIVRKANFTLISKSMSGPSGDKSLNVRVRFFNGISQSESADVLDNDWRLRIQVEGFEGGQELINFKGVIVQRL